MLKTIAVDDQPEILESVTSHIKKLPYVHLVCSTTSSKDSLNYFQSTKIDVAILDIDMPEVNGLSLAEWINENSPNTKIIFCTSHGGYIRDAYRLYAYDFIEKPIDFNRLRQSLDRLNDTIDTEEELLEFNTLEGTRFFKATDIVAIEAQGKHAILYSKNNTVEVKESFKAIEEMMNLNCFYKSSRSYIVNLCHVIGLEKFNRTSFIIKLSNPEAYAQLSKKSYEDFKVQLSACQA